DRLLDARHELRHERADALELPSEGRVDPLQGLIDARNLLGHRSVLSGSGAPSRREACFVPLTPQGHTLLARSPRTAPCRERLGRGLAGRPWRPCAPRTRWRAAARSSAGATSGST